MSNNEKNEFATKVAEHYNQVEQKSVKERNQSVIIDLRKFNNAMKSLMHHVAFKYAHYISSPTNTYRRRHYRVLDLGCGKGGDLPKYFRNDQVELIVGVDIAETSIQQAKERYKKMKHSSGRNFKGEFFVADLTRVDISEELKKINCLDKFHIASTQFSIHYSFESYDQAVRYISNAADNLMKHGLFIGTYPDGPKLLKLARESETPGLYEVDDILSVKFSQEDLDNPKPFGTKYHFKLREVVDCPEFLVHPEVLKRLLISLGFYQVFDRSFEEHLTEAINSADDGEKVKGIFHDFNALEFDSEHKKARLNETMWRAASVYRCFCYKRIN